MENFEDLSKQYFNVRASKGNKISKIDIKKGRRIKESFNIDAHIVDAGCGENRFRNYFTNLSGICKFTVTQGNEYLIDNVILELNENPKNDIFWTSYWAALTFRASNEIQ